MGTRDEGTSSIPLQPPDFNAAQVSGAPWGQRLQRLGSIRVGCVSLFVALGAAFVSSLVWEPLAGIVFLIVFLLMMIAAVFNDDNILYCPHCRKRVKMGANTCHHCARAVK